MKKHPYSAAGSGSRLKPSQSYPVIRGANESTTASARRSITGGEPVHTTGTAVSGSTKLHKKGGDAQAYRSRAMTMTPVIAVRPVHG